MHIALISCSKTKRSYACPARDMYDCSVLFRKTVAYIQRRHYDIWFVLSAKHCLLLPDQVIAPYEMTLNTMSGVRIQKWAWLVFQELIKYKPKQVDIFAGERYYKYLLPLLEQNGICYSTPLQGLPLGRRLQYLTLSVKSEMETLLE